MVFQVAIRLPAIVMREVQRSNGAAHSLPSR